MRGERLAYSQTREGYLYPIVIHRHFLPCIHPSYKLVLYIINGLIALNNARVTALLMYVLTFPPDMTQRTCIVCACVCAWTHVCFHSGNSNTPGALTSTLSHILYNTWDTVTLFAVSPHTLLTLAHNANFTKEIHPGTVCV